MPCKDRIAALISHSQGCQGDPAPLRFCATLWYALCLISNDSSDLNDSSARECRTTGTKASHGALDGRPSMKPESLFAGDQKIGVIVYVVVKVKGAGSIDLLFIILQVYCSPTFNLTAKDPEPFTFITTGFIFGSKAGTGCTGYSWARCNGTWFVDGGGGQRYQGLTLQPESPPAS